jgi:hypothetical protein
MRDGTVIGWPMWLGMLALSVAAGGCALDEAHGAVAARADGGRKPALAHRKRAHPDAGHHPAAAPEAQSSMVGLTRAQLEARFGPPTAKRGREWIYTPPQPGCQEEIVSEILTFKGDVVASVDLEWTRTNKVCGRPNRNAE